MSNQNDQGDTRRGRRSLRLRQRGFTLIELIMVILLVSVLSVVALPRMFDLNAWRLRAFADDMQSTTAAVQRRALAQRKPVVATFAVTGVTFAYVAGGAVAGVNPVLCPGAVPACLTGASVGTATFNALNAGNTVVSPSALTISVTDGAVTLYSFQLENDTGLMRRLP